MTTIFNRRGTKKMSNVIAFLESMGKDASAHSSSADEFVAAVNALGLDDAPRQALLDRDDVALGDLLGGRMKMMCLLFPADGEGEEKKDDQPDDGDGDDEQKEQIGLH